MVSRSLGPRPTQPQNSAARYKMDVARDQSRSLLRCDPDKPMKGCGYHALNRRGRAQRRVTKAAFSEAVLASIQADAVAWNALYWVAVEALVEQRPSLARTTGNNKRTRQIKCKQTTMAFNITFPTCIGKVRTRITSFSTVTKAGCLIPELGRSLNPIQAATMAERFVTPGETGQESGGSQPQTSTRPTCREQ